METDSHAAGNGPREVATSFLPGQVIPVRALRRPAAGGVATAVRPRGPGRLCRVRDTRLESEQRVVPSPVVRRWAAELRRVRSANRWPRQPRDSPVPAARGARWQAQELKGRMAPGRGGLHVRRRQERLMPSATRCVSDRGGRRECAGYRSGSPRVAGSRGKQGRGLLRSARRASRRLGRAKRGRRSQGTCGSQSPVATEAPCAIPHH